VNQASGGHIFLHRPRGIQIKEIDGVLHITRKWFSLMFIFLLIFTVLWNSIFIYYIFIDSPRGTGENPTKIMPFFQFALGLALLYYNITGLLNKTTITLSSTSLSVKHSPLPWPGKMKIARSEIEQLFVEKNIRKTKSSVIILFDLNIITKTDSRIRLLKNLSDKDQALYIENILEDKLNIKDRVVPEEVDK